MPRKRARLANQQPTSVVTATGSASGTASSQAMPTRKHLRGKLGGLRDMPNMPMDILIEIFSHLLPMDLLNLARTSKPFRRLLMNRSSASLWKISRRLVENLPDCPAHLSEPAYANLVFSPHCHNCLRPQTQSIWWEFAVRYCRFCKKALTVTLLDDDPAVVFLYDNLPEISHLVNWLPGKSDEIYHLPQLQEVQRNCQGLCDDEIQLSQYEYEQSQKVQAIREHALECEIWAEDRAAARASALEDMREKRLEFILGKLREMGWGDEIDKLPIDLYPLSDHAQVRVAREITERTWTKIRDNLTKFMQDIQDTRLAEERSDIIQKRLSLLDGFVTEMRAVSLPEEVHLKFIDFATMPEYRALLDVPTDPDAFDEDALRALVDRVPSLKSQWYAQKEEHLARMLEVVMGRVHAGQESPQGGGGESEDREHARILQLALSVLECKCCDERMEARSALSHRCARQPGLPWSSYPVVDDPDITPGTYMHEVRAFCPWVCPWSPECFRVPDLEPLRRVIRTCGKDPNTVTANEMHALDLRLAVTLADGRRRVMQWEDVVRAGHLDDTVVGNAWHFEVLSDSAKRRAAVLEREKSKWLGQLLVQGGLKYWCCRLCDVMSCGCTYDEILCHLEFSHFIDVDADAGAEDEHIFLHPDVMFLLAKSAVLLPSA